MQGSYLATLADAGVLVADESLSSDVCASLRECACQSVTRETAVLKNGVSVVDSRVRKARETAVDLCNYCAVGELLVTVKPQLESFFSTKLKGNEPPRLLLYERGDFFRKHTDLPSHEKAPAYLKKRKISVVIFVNSEAKEHSDHTYRGGRLIFYRLEKAPHTDDFRLSVPGVEGTLVAFRADLVHEVTPVVVGMRASIVTWFF